MSEASGIPLSSVYRLSEEKGSEISRRKKYQKMKSKTRKPKFRTQVEKGIQDRFRDFLEKRGWLVERIIAGATQHGLPDLYAFHPAYGQRWIDLKVAKKNIITKRQAQKWPLWEKYHLGVWIVTGDHDYPKLFEPPNFREYWKPSYDKYCESVEEILKEMG